MKNALLTGLLPVILALAVVPVPRVAAHCQVPCGIYDDEARLRLLEEHATTIEKAMQQITALSKEPATHSNQLIRWVMAKEEHAEKIQDLVSSYFLAQRIKVPQSSEAEEVARYHRHLELLHRIVVAAMKAKQTTDLGQVESLRSLVKEFRKAYLTAEK